MNGRREIAGATHYDESVIHSILRHTFIHKTFGALLEINAKLSTGYGTQGGAVVKMGKS